jgi:hypothetical protein
MLVLKRIQRYRYCFVLKYANMSAVLRIRIRIHRIPMFLGLQDPDLLVRDMDPDPDPSIILQK